jgi:NADH-quinone oxidoreductase subunit J
MLEACLFYLFAALTLGGAILTITRRNAVLSAVWLTVSLLGVAGIFLLQGAEFLFVSQIILYIGGITLLFLFVIMLVNLDAISHVRQFRRAWPVLSLAALGLAAELIVLLCRGASASANAAISSATQITPVASANTEQISDLLFSRYFVAFELASVLLLAAIVGSVWMGQDRKSSSRSSQERPQERRIPS